MKKIIFLLAMFFTIFAISQEGNGEINLPNQRGNAGKYLKTDGKKLSWNDVTAGVSASLTPNYIPYAVSSTSLASSPIYYNGTNFGIGTTSPSLKLDIISNDNGDFTCQKLISNNALKYLSLGWGGLKSSYYMKFQTGAYNDFQFLDSHDGVGSGVPNYSNINTVGSTLYEYKVPSASSHLSKYYQNGIVTMTTFENYGYYNHSVKNRFTVLDLNTTKTKFQVDMSTGFVGIGDDYFTPDSRMHIYDSKPSTILKISNDNYSGYMGLHLYNNVGTYSQLLSTNSGFSTYGAVKPNVTVLYGSSDLVLMSDNNHSIKFAVGVTPATEKIQIKPNGVLNFIFIPTSSVGLVSGDVWNDSGTLKIVP